VLFGELRVAMVDSLQAQIESLLHSIEGLEAQRAMLGEEIVNPALSALQQQLAELEKQVAAQAAPVEERRMVTILFFDIVGSTSLAEKLDPEEWRQVVSQVHTSLGEAVSSHHGTVAQYLGDGLLAFFGSQQASEHDPENAIRAALDGHTTVAALSLPHQIQLRGGIHTGLVVVGELGDAIHKEFTASGDAVNLAARLQSAAPPGGTLISHDTYRYVRGVFNLTPQPPLTVKGKSEPLQSYLVRSAKPRPFRSVARGVAGVETRTIGREQEMQALQAAYLRSYEGHSLVWAQLVSEPGLGKSRLMSDLIDWIDLRPETTWLLRARAFPDDANQPFALIRRMWLDRFQIAEDAPLEIVEAKWVERFKELSSLDNFEEPAQALGLLVGLQFERSLHIQGMRSDPTQVKGRAFVVSRELLTAMRRLNSVVLLLEDLQWTDPASWEYLNEVFLDPSTLKQPNGLFILGAARTEWHPPQALLDLISSSSSYDEAPALSGRLIMLAPLPDPSMRELAIELLQRTDDVPPQVIDLLVERSDGVPYFTEEIVNWFIDHGILDIRSERWKFLPERLKAQALPATLQHLLLTRLSSLSQPERAALQRGAIFGRRFWAGGVEALGVPAGAEVFGHLQPRGFVEAQPESSFQGDTEWSFQQSMLQEVTYESVLKRERATLHKVAAGWLEQQARQAGRVDEFSGLLADHYERAGELGTAADWYLLAGQRAMHQGAPREASGFYTKALDLLPPIDRERRWQALLGREAAYSILGEADLWRADLDACQELAHVLENDHYLAEIYFRLAVFGLHTGNYHMVEQASEQSLLAAKRCGDETLEAKALIMSAVASTHQSDQSIVIQKTEQAVQLARQQPDENALAFVLFRAAFCYGEIGVFTGWYPLYVELVDLTHRLGDRVQEARVLGNFGEAHLSNGLYKSGRAMIEQAVQIQQAIGDRRSLAYSYLNLAGIFWHTGDLRNAKQYLENAYKEITLTHDTRGLVDVLIGLGIGAVEINDASGAVKRFGEGRELALSHDLPALAQEATVGLAASKLRQGKLEEAQKYVWEAWDYLKEYGWREMSAPGWVYLTCAETFDALGDIENYREVLEAGHRVLLDVADRKNILAWRQSFLENVPEHRRLIELWERMQQ
jgi:class 3 adenylate cyclase/tetratricopeptide (TPR) repeat protein